MRRSALNLKILFFPLILLVIGATISIRNYVPNTYLSGWDTLHPEFNFGLYWSRILDGAWQEHQGLGAVASQAHASEIPRVLILQILDLFLSNSQIRYFYMFLMIVLGPLGVYAFMYSIFLKNKDLWVKSLGAFAGGLFYLLNLGTLQNFYVPLEMFVTHFGFLGWLFLTIGKYVEDGSKKWLFWTAVVTFVSTSQAHTPTLFFTLLFAVLLFLVMGIFQDRSKNAIKKSLFVLVTILFVNSFWIFPSIYFLVSKSEAVSSSKIHSLFSEEAFLQNKQFGNLKDVSILKNFLFNWGEHLGGGRFGDLLNEWKIHNTSFLVEPIGYVFFILIVFGAVYAGIKKEKYFLHILGIFLVSLFFIFNENPPLGFLFAFFRDNIPLFKELFRFPFTKFSIILAFTYSVFFGYFVSYSILQAKKIAIDKRNLNIDVFITFALLTFSLVYYMKPAFNGSFISPSMKIAIPDRYFQLFEYMNLKNEYGRVADFPMHSFWGWSFYNWSPVTGSGYQGAGFLWFGIKQPLLNREFDRWESANEQYYREFSYAVNSQDAVSLGRLIKKYNVKWLLLDDSVMLSGETNSKEANEKVRELLRQIPEISLDKSFGSGLDLYIARNIYQHEYVLDDFNIFAKQFIKEPSDPYLESGDYIYLEGYENRPFVGINSDDESINSHIIKSNADQTMFINEAALSSDGSLWLDVGLSSDKLSLRNKSTKEIESEITLPNGVSVLKVGSKLFHTPKEPFENKILTSVSGMGGEILPVTGYSVSGQEIQYLKGFSMLETCSDVGQGTSYSIEDYKGSFKLTSKNVNTCVTAPLSSFVEQVENGKLLSLSLSFEGMGSVGDVCVLDSKTGGCVGSYSLDQSKIIVFFELNSAIEDYYLRFFSNSSGVGETYVMYSDVVLGFLDPVLSSEFTIPNILASDEVGVPLTFEKQYNFSDSKLQSSSSPYNCSSGLRDIQNGSVEYSLESGVQYRAELDPICDRIELRSYDSESGYIIEIESRNLSGLPARLCLLNETTGRCDLYVSLPDSDEFVKSFYLVPPSLSDYKYTLTLTNLVFGTIGSENDVRNISLTPVPYQYIRGLSSGGGKLQNLSSQVYVLSESFDDGWLALCSSGLKTGLCQADHVKVNNWANGWHFKGGIPQDTEITVVFWPQYLQYFGMILAGATLTFLYAAYKKESKRLKNDL